MKHPRREKLKKTFNNIKDDLKKSSRIFYDLSSVTPKRNIKTNEESIIRELLTKDISEIKAKLKERPEIISRVEGDTGEVFIISAVKKKRLDIVELLLDSGVSVDTLCPKNDRTIYRPDDRGFDTHPQSKKYGSPLFYAADNGSIEIVKLLLEKNADTEVGSVAFATPLHMAARHGRLDIVKELLNASANIDAKDDLGNTALFYAITNRQTEVAKYLIANGADVNVRNRKNNTPLHAAANEGEKEILEILINNGADVNIANEFGETALYISIPEISMTAPSHFKTYHEMVALLLSNGADPDIYNKKDADTPLTKASFYGHYPVVDMLIKKNADIDMSRDNSANALIISVRASPKSGNRRNHYKHITKTLIQNGIAINEQDSQGKTALFYACYNDDIEMAKLLLENGAEANIYNIARISPLNLAASNKNTDMLMLLLKNGADHKHQVQDNETLIEFAKNKYNNDEIVDILRKWKISQRRKYKKTQTLHQEKKQAERTKRQQHLRKFVRRPRK